jgi:hypothetical protein
MNASQFRKGRHVAQLVKGDVGMVVQGNVTPRTLVLNVGGQPRPLAELKEQQLIERRRHIRAAIGYRRRLGYLPRICMVAGAALLWFVSSAFLTHEADVGETVAMLCAVATLPLSAVTSWCAVQLYAGAWARRQRRVRRELESVLAKIDAELDMRRPLSAFSRRALLDALLNRHRQLMPKRVKKKAA